MRTDRAYTLASQRLAGLHPDLIVAHEDLAARLAGLDLRIDVPHATSFLAELGEAHCFQTFSEAPISALHNRVRGEGMRRAKREGLAYDAVLRATRDPLARARFGSLAQHRAELQELGRLGACVCHTPNEVSGDGRRNENLTRVRCVWADDLSAPDVPGWCPEPTLCVCTSPGSWHAYWLFPHDAAIDAGDAQGLLGAICERLGADRGAGGLVRALRMPGTWHLKDPDRPHLVTWRRGGPRHEPAALMDAFGVAALPRSVVVRPVEPAPEGARTWRKASRVLGVVDIRYSSAPPRAEAELRVSLGGRTVVSRARLVIHTDARAPKQLALVLQCKPAARLAWNRLREERDKRLIEVGRRDLVNGSPRYSLSEDRFALVNCLARCGLTAQQIANALIAWLARHGESEQLHKLISRPHLLAGEIALIRAEVLALRTMRGRRRAA